MGTQKKAEIPPNSESHSQFWGATATLKPTTKNVGNVLD